MASKEQLHLIWIAITGVDVIKLPLVDIFALYVQPADLYKNIEGTSLIAGKNELQSDQLKICYVLPPDLPDYNKFDFSLLYTLLTFVSYGEAITRMGKKSKFHRFVYW